MSSAAVKKAEVPVEVAGRVALYLRVSTPRQADHDLSIPDQRRQLEDYCRSHSWQIAAQFVEPGVSGTDDRRPAFQGADSRIERDQRPGAR